MDVLVVVADTGALAGLPCDGYHVVATAAAAAAALRERTYARVLVDPAVPGALDAVQGAAPRTPALTTSARTLAEHIREGVVVQDADGTVAQWNAAAARILGLPHDEVGDPAAYAARWAGVGDDGAPLAEHPAATALRTGERVEAAVVGIDPPGEGRRWLEVTSSPLLRPGADQPYAVLTTFKDITVRRAAQEEARRLAAIIDSSDDAIIGRTLDGIVTSWNPAAERLTGYPADEAIGRHATFTSLPGRERLIHDVIGRIQRGENIPPYETVVVRKDGSHVHISLTISPIRDETGTVVGSSAIARDISEQVRLRTAAEADRRRLAEAQAVAKLGSFEHILDTGEISWSDEMYRIFGLPVRSPLDYGSVVALVHPDDYAEFARGRTEAMQSADSVEFRYRIVRPDGETRRVSARVGVHRDASGHADRLVGTVLDVTERARADDERRRAERRFELGFERAAAGTAIADLQGRFVRVNAALCALLGRTEEELTGRHPDEFLHEQHGTAASPFADAVAGESRTGVEVRFARPGGAGIDTLVDVTVVHGDSGAPEYLFAQVLDITRRKQAERALAHQALHDALTGLPNRVLLLDRLDHALAQRDRRTSAIAVLLVDLDQFKLVNDGLGHSAGDALLVAAADRLAKAVRPGDTVCRLGGDEFVICCENVGGAEEAMTIGERVRAAFSQPFVVERRELFVTASVGVTLASVSSTADSLLRDADAAMYRAKERGRARVEVFDDGLRERATARLATATSLRRALQDGEFEVHYQPVMSLADERLTGFEALVRWNDPERGLVPPAEFIGIAEETGLIVPLGELVLREATRQLAEWSARFPGGPDLTVSVNVSGRQMVDAALVPTVAEALRESGIAPNRLHLEITETVLMDDIDESLEVLRALDELGVTLEIDDFGTGYSSLSYLKRLPVDTLKVDRSFVSGLGTDSEDTSIVTAITALGRALGLRLHAEGVENELQRAAVRALGCDVAQGFHWSPPLPAREAERWLRRPLAVVPEPRGVRRAVAG
jgi:diguanylate cyclase (GGDEF)-like protein/PAS domain S-box-containing protein